MPGEATVCGPLLPDAITNSVPYWAESASTSCAIGSVPSEAKPESPRLMLTTAVALLGGPLHAGHHPGVLAGAGRPSEHLADVSSAPGATPL